MLAINLVLLLLGTAGALAAFGGETWKKGDEPLRKRVTHRGWLALSLMVGTLAFGIVKEVLTRNAAATATLRQGDLEDKLIHASADLNEAKERLASTAAELSATRAKLAAVEPNIIRALMTATQGLRREQDFATSSVSDALEQQLRSGRTGDELVLYGGDLVDYTIYCSSTSGRTAGLPISRFVPPRFSLAAGGSEYPLMDQGRQMMIIGPVGMPMRAVLWNHNRTPGCQLKLLVESADRTREAAQLQPLLQMINDARESLPVATK